MAKSTCVKCGRLEFEVQIHKPLLSKFPIVFVQCAICGDDLHPFSHPFVTGVSRSLGQLDRTLKDLTSYQESTRARLFLD
jgi:hypothetical protein